MIRPGGGENEKEKDSLKVMKAPKRKKKPELR